MQNTTKISEESHLYLVDFDGTLTFRDSFVGFLRFSVSPLQQLLWMPYFFGVSLGFFTGLLDNGKAKEVLLRPFFGGMSNEEFTAKARAFGTSKWLNSSVREELLQHLLEVSACGRTVVIVSASLGVWVAAWAEQHGFASIATEHEVNDGMVTGALATKNCYGVEKVRRITEQYKAEDYTYIEAWGNSRGDREMLLFAHCAYYKGRPLTL